MNARPFFILEWNFAPWVSRFQETLSASFFTAATNRSG